MSEEKIPHPEVMALTAMGRLLKDNNEFTPECGQAMASLADSYNKLYRTKHKIAI